MGGHHDQLSPGERVEIGVLPKEAPSGETSGEPPTIVGATPPRAFST